MDGEPVYQDVQPKNLEFLDQKYINFISRVAMAPQDYPQNTESINIYAQEPFNTVIEGTIDAIQEKGLDRYIVEGTPEDVVKKTLVHMKEGLNRRWIRSGRELSENKWQQWASDEWKNEVQEELVHLFQDTVGNKTVGLEDSENGKRVALAVAKALGKNLSSYPFWNEYLEQNEDGRNLKTGEWRHEKRAFKADSYWLWSLQRLRTKYTIDKLQTLIGFENVVPGRQDISNHRLNSVRGFFQSLINAGIMQS